MFTYLVSSGLELGRQARRDRASQKPACRGSRRPWSRPVVEALGLVALGLLLGFPGKPKAGFVTAPSYPAGPGPSSVVVGDFNGDGYPDVAVVNQSASMVTVLLGNGDGTLQASQSCVLAGPPTSVAVGDFNGDGHLDLAVAVDVSSPGGSSSAFQVLLGNGDGTFSGAQTAYGYAGGYDPGFVALGDFNGDGHLDLAVANRAGTLSILLGNGDGTLQAAQSYAVGFPASSIAVGDFNGDGHLDLAVASHNYGAIDVLLGKGDGTFQAAQSYTVGDSPQSVAVGDFNGRTRVETIPAASDRPVASNNAAFAVFSQRAEGTATAFASSAKKAANSPVGSAMPRRVNRVRKRSRARHS
jgi:FG-GAP-like repeat